MDKKTKKAIKKRMLEILNEKGVLLLNDEHVGVMQQLCKEFDLEQSVHAVPITDIFESLKSYEAYTPNSRFPNEIKKSPQYIKDQEKSLIDKIKMYPLPIIGTTLVFISLVIEFKGYDGKPLDFLKNNVALVVGNILIILGLIDKK